MEIKENEFIRTKTGKIDKVINNNYYMSQYIECEKRIVEKENIIKHSFNIIDLIESRDIIEFKIKNFDFTNLGIVHEEFDSRKGEYYKIVNEHRLEEIQIISILTKEQYERDCYKAKEKWWWVIL